MAQKLGLEVGLLLPRSKTTYLVDVNQYDLTSPLGNRLAVGQGTHFRLAAVGDVLLHQSIQELAEARGYDFLFGQLQPFLRAADLTYANFEGTSDPNQPLSSFPRFNYNPALATALKKAGVNIVSTANNHAVDTGSLGIDQTLSVLKKARLLSHGTRQRGTIKKSYKLLTLTAKDGLRVKIGFLSFASYTNNLPDPYRQVNMLWNRYGRIAKQVRNAIAKAREETDFVIVAAHWGREYEFCPTAKQRQGMEDLVASGADIVLGCHPHTLQPLSWVNKNGRQGLGIYSLGNFIATHHWFRAASFTQTSVILYIDFVRLPSGKTVVSGYQYLPIQVSQNLQPVPILPQFNPHEYQHVLAKMRDPHGLYAVHQ